MYLLGFKPGTKNCSVGGAKVPANFSPPALNTLYALGPTPLQSLAMS